MKTVLCCMSSYVKNVLHCDDALKVLGYNVIYFCLDDYYSSIRVGFI